MLKDKIKQDYKQAFKEKDIIKKDILNYILSQIKNKEIDLQKQLDDTDVIKIIQKEIKSRKESIDFLKKSWNQEEVEIENKKIEILEQYLPKMLSKQELEDLVEQYISKLNINDLKKQRWILIKQIMTDYPWQIDWKLLNEVITSKI